LDVVGDRWALLVVRELLFGPKRFVQLRAGLRSVSPNVLSQRLRDLEDADVVRRDVLDQPASVAIYELTDRGRELEPILLALGRWGSEEPATSTSELSVNSLMLAMKTVFASAADATGEYALRIDGQWFAVTIAGGSIDITAGRTDKAAVTFETDVATLRSVAFGRDSISRAEQDGRLTVRGDRDLAEQFTTLFPVPRQLRR
jgi:DNA-binding HxlR family transcriptional regulator